ncbi:MAG: tetratricopeptide repeat protein, partial [bacterium]
RLAPVPVAAVALVALAVLIFVWTSQPRHLEIPDGTRSAITVALSEGASSGMLEPAVAAFPAADLPVFRSGASPSHHDLNVAIRELNQLAENHPENVTVVAWLATAYLAAGQLSNARAFLEQALQWAPDDGELLQLSAIVAYRESRLDQAERQLRRVLAADPQLPTAKFNLGILLLGQGQLDEAAALLRQAGEQAPGSVLARRAQQVLPQLESTSSN